MPDYNVSLQNPYTKETQTVPIGWSWRLFLLSPLLGIVLFRRGLTYWGLVFLALSFLAIVGRIQADPDGYSTFTLVRNVIAFSLMLFIGFKGNELTARNYLARGWQFLDPDGDAVRYAKAEWQLDKDFSLFSQSAR